MDLSNIKSHQRNDSCNMACNKGRCCNITVVNTVYALWLWSTNHFSSWCRGLALCRHYLFFPPYFMSFRRYRENRLLFWHHIVKHFLVGLAGSFATACGGWQSSSESEGHYPCFWKLFFRFMLLAKKEDFILKLKSVVFFSHSWTCETTVSKQECFWQHGMNLGQDYIFFDQCQRGGVFPFYMNDSLVPKPSEILHFLTFACRHP